MHLADHSFLILVVFCMSASLPPFCLTEVASIYTDREDRGVTRVGRRQGDPSGQSRVSYSQCMDGR